MKKVVFKNKVFEKLLLLCLAILCLYNLSYLLKGYLLSLIPMSVQALLILLVLIKYQYVKTILLVWSGVFLILSNILKIGAAIIFLLVDESRINFPSTILSFFFLGTGLLIFYYSKGTIEIKAEEIRDNNPKQKAKA